MSTYLGTQLLSGVGTNTIANAHSLFDFKWSDHILNEMSWLRSDTYSWHNGDVYVAAYNHLENDLENYVSAETDIIDGIEIWYVVSPDGHKIIDAGYPDQEHRTLAAEQLYNKTGVSWYYIIDRVNKRFKLPRENPAREVLGQSAPVTSTKTDTNNISGFIWSNSGNNLLITNNQGQAIASDLKLIGNTDLSETTGVYKGKQYLYFYVGDYDVSDIKGINLENRNAITNCIIEIPQNIKLEINNGALTLKAGSKVYVPNGFESDGTTPKFDKVSIDSDVSQTFGTSNNSRFIFYKLSTGLLSWYNVNNCSTGTTPPTTGGLYNTTTNKIIGYVDGGVDGPSLSFPICRVTLSSGNVVSIDQICNGFGYFGSTMFILPGVKCLIPNGRNSDGTLKNIEAEAKSVLTRTTNSNQTGLYHFGLSYTNTIGMVVDSYYEYSKTNNRNYASGDLWLTTPFASMILTNGVISNFNPKQAFHALDYNDISYVTKNILEVLYPVGGVYIGTQTSCPMTLLMPGTTWELVSAGKALWTGNGTTGSGTTSNANFANAPANTTIDAGLPQHTHTYSEWGRTGGTNVGYDTNNNRVFYNESRTTGNASDNIYGNSTTVQPPAYVVNVWRRTA